MKCTRCKKEHNNSVNDMCYRCFSAIQDARKNADKKKHDVRLRRRNRKRCYREL